jgi:Mn2+/Fe2+ NRAMP family transporter
MFTIQTAVTIVTAGIAFSLFGSSFSLELWAVIILGFCFLLLLLGRYNLLDKMMKIIIILLSISTLLAVGIAFNNSGSELPWAQVFPTSNHEVIFLIAFMGWMPAPLDVSIWHSLWAVEKQKTTDIFEKKSALLDFNIGYVSTIILGVCFLLLGGLVMYGSGKSFSDSGGEFSLQLIDMYTENLGDWSFAIIGVAAFTTMFSTTLTTLDASPRAMNKTVELILDKKIEKGYSAWLILLIVGTAIVFFFFLSEMGSLIKIATILSFLTAPFYAIMNYLVLCSKHTPKAWQPSKIMHILSIFGILFLVGFNIWYLSIL